MYNYVAGSGEDTNEDEEEYAEELTETGAKADAEKGKAGAETKENDS